MLDMEELMASHIQKALAIPSYALPANPLLSHICKEGLVWHFSCGFRCRLSSVTGAAKNPEGLNDVVGKQRGAIFVEALVFCLGIRYSFSLLCIWLLLGGGFALPSRHNPLDESLKRKEEQIAEKEQAVQLINSFFIHI